MYDLDSNWLDAVETDLEYVLESLDQGDERECEQLTLSRRFPNLTIGEAIEELMCDPGSGWQDGWTLQAVILMWDDVSAGVKDALIDAVSRNPTNGYLAWRKIRSLTPEHTLIIQQRLKSGAPNLYKKMMGGE